MTILRKNEVYLDYGKLRELMAAKGYNYSDVSKKVGMSDGWLVNIVAVCKGKVKVTHLNALAQLLGVVPADLIGKGAVTGLKCQKRLVNVARLNETKLNALIKKLGCTRKFLSRQCGKNDAWLSRTFTTRGGRVNRNQLEKLACVLKVEPETLLAEEKPGAVAENYEVPAIEAAEAPEASLFKDEDLGGNKMDLTKVARSAVLNRGENMPMANLVKTYPAGITVNEIFEMKMTDGSFVPCFKFKEDRKKFIFAKAGDLGKIVGAWLEAAGGDYDELNAALAANPVRIKIELRYYAPGKYRVTATGVE